MKKILTIGSARVNYPEERFFSHLKNIEIKNLEKYDVNRYINKIRRGNKKSDYFFKSLLNDTFTGVDSFYMFNYLLDTKKKWALSFETLIPRISDTYDIHRQIQKLSERKTDESIIKYLDLLSRDNCLAINAISQMSFNIQRDFLSPYTDFFEEILKKTKVIHPPQNVYLTDKAENKNEKLKLLFVGNDFHRKGGGEILIALDELIKDNLIKDIDLEVLLIGDFEKKCNYAFNIFQDDTSYYDNLRSIIKNNNFINVVKSIDNKDLLILMSQYDIGLLPTWADTYGYSVLEMQSMSLPVITTNIRTLPEINLPENIIYLEVNSYGEVIINSYENKSRLRRFIIDGIKEKILYYFFNREMILKNSKKSITSLKLLNNPDIFRKEINRIFS